MKHGLLRMSRVFLLLPVLFACKKSSTGSGTASLTLINAVAGSNILATNFSDTYSIEWYYSAMQVQYGSYSPYYETSSYSGTQPLKLYQYPDTLEKSTPLFDLRIDLLIGSVHTLFLTGTTSAPDTLFTTDILPVHPPQDSSFGIRLVNLSPGSGPVSVNIQGQANGSETASLPYKSITAFKTYPATSATGSYVFEFRDAAGILLGSYTFDGVNNDAGNNTANNLWRYRNFTLILAGLPAAGTTGSTQIVFLANNY